MTSIQDDRKHLSPDGVSARKMGQTFAETVAAIESHAAPAPASADRPPTAKPSTEAGRRLWEHWTDLTDSATVDQWWRQTIVEIEQQAAIAAVRDAHALREENKRLRALSVALDDYLWEVSPRDEAGTCRVCGVREGVAHDHSKVCGRLADARAALSPTEPAAGEREP